MIVGVRVISGVGVEAGEGAIVGLAGVITGAAGVPEGSAGEWVAGRGINSGLQPAKPRIRKNPGSRSQANLL